MTGLRRVTGLIVCSCLMWAAPAAADPITELNLIAAETIFAGGRPAGAPPLLDFAMVHAAIHDAVQASEKRFKHYAVRIRDAPARRWPPLPQPRATSWSIGSRCRPTRFSGSTSPS